jgi:DNA polymerase-3 subunit alpha
VSESRDQALILSLEWWFRIHLYEIEHSVGPEDFFDIGYQNLMRLSSIANIDGMYYKPRIDHDLLEKYNEGLIVLSGCIGGEVGDLLRQDQYDQAKKVAEWYKSIFGDRYYIEIQDHGHPEHPSRWDEQVKAIGISKSAASLVKPSLSLTCSSHLDGCSGWPWS